MLLREIKIKLNKTDNKKLEELSSMKKDLIVLKNSLSMLKKEKEKLRLSSSLNGLDTSSSFSLLSSRYDYVEKQIRVLQGDINILEHSIK